MRKIIFKKKVKSSLSQIEKKINKNFFEKMIPSFYPIGIHDYEGTQDGAEFTLALKGPYALKIWKGQLHSFSKNEREYQFVDEGKKLPFPFKSWLHKHRFVESQAGGTYLVDEIEFDCGDEKIEAVMEIILTIYFKYRQLQYQKILKG